MIYTSEIYADDEKDIFIKAENIEIGENVELGRSIDICVKGNFIIGDRSRLGDDVIVRGRNIEFGSDLFHYTHGLRVGGGGSNGPDANLRIGDRCTIHDNFINICKPVWIGDDVGLSPGVDILTHGFWLSVLEGYPAKFAPVKIYDGVIIGWRSLILMGVTIGERAVIGAQSVVTGDVESECVYAGSPARLIRKIEPQGKQNRCTLLAHILEEYERVSDYHSISPHVTADYPIVKVNDCSFNVETLIFDGTEDEETDDFRDYVRRWGLRFYSKRPFKSVWQW